VAGDRLRRILTVVSVDGEPWSSMRLCGVCPELVGVSGAGVMLMSGDVPRGSLCASDEVSHLLEDLQYTMGEGPCVDAYQQDRVVIEPDLADPATPRWLGFTPRAVRAGARAVFGFPLRVGTVRLGALDLYRDRPGDLSSDQHADALVLADLTASGADWLPGQFAFSGCTPTTANWPSMPPQPALERGSSNSSKFHCGSRSNAEKATSRSYSAPGRHHLGFRLST